MDVDYDDRDSIDLEDTDTEYETNPLDDTEYETNPLDDTEYETNPLDDTEYQTNQLDDIEYETKPVVSTIVDDNCCRKQCLKEFDDDFKLRLKDELSMLESKEKKLYLFAMISINQEKKFGVKKQKSSKYYEYTVKEYGIPRSVCKTAFVTLHDTTPALVRVLCEKMSSNYLIPTDNRGRHDKRPTIPENMKELIKSHFCETLTSPTIFKCLKKAFGDPNIHQLWVDFKQKHGHIACSTYTKYVRLVITPEVLNSFMCANEANQILTCIKKYERRIK